MFAPTPFLPFLAVILGAGVGSAAFAAGGLQPPTNDALWPSLRARITVQAAAVSPLSFAGLAGGAQGLRGGSVLGDYVFAEPSFGSFRATSGVVFGSHAGAPQFSTAASAEAWQAAPYLGLGFSSPLGDSGFSLSADLGWVAESVSPGSDPFRTPLGVQGSDNQRRELRLSPLLQFGMRYTF